MLRRSRPVVLLLCLFALIGLSTANAQVVVTRPLAPALAGEYSGMYSQQVADSFPVGATVRVVSLSWYGMYHVSAVSGGETFVVRVFRSSVSGGPEAAPVWSWSGVATGVTTGETHTWPGGDVVPWFRYSIALPGWTLEPGTYWLSVVNDGGGSYDWLWADTDQGGRRAYRNGDTDAWDGFHFDDQHHAFAIEASIGRGQVIVYSQTSLAGSTGRVPGLFDQLGRLVVDSHRDFYEIFTNTGPEVSINRAVLWGNVESVSKAVIVPLVPGVANGLPMLVPDRDPAHVLSEATVYPTTPNVFGPIAIVFPKPVTMTTGMKLAFGFIAPLQSVVDATLFGTDTLPNDLTSDTPPYYTGFYSTNGAGTELGLCVGNHYLEIKSVPPPGDFNGDGTPDILWHHQPSGTLYSWFMKDRAQVGGGYLSPTAIPSEWQIKGVADFNADGRSDILWHHQPSGTLYAWFMDGTTQVGGGYLTPMAIPSEWQIKGVADFNRDGAADILWHHQPSGTLYAWFMNGTTQVGGGYLTPMVIPSEWQIKGVADFNRDGAPDILWHHQPSGTLYAWFMNGTTQIGGEYLTPDNVSTDWQICQVADFNGDGAPDLLFHNQKDGSLFVWLMRGTTQIGGGYLSPSKVSTDWQIRQ